MRDLSALEETGFDLVYQEISLGYVPDPAPVYREVARVLQSGGVYRVAHSNPAVAAVEETSWGGRGYRIDRPYRGGPEAHVDGGSITFTHLLPDILNGLTAAGLAIESVWEDPRHIHHRPDAQPGTCNHMLTYVAAYFAIVARKQ